MTIQALKAPRILVFPRVHTELAPGALRWIFGGGLGLRGADANVVNASLVDTTQCAVGLDMMSMYGPTVQRLGSQGNFAGMCFGLRPSGAMVSANIGALYTEGDRAAFIALIAARHQGAYHIATEYALELSTEVLFIPMRYADNRTVHNGLYGYTILMDGELLSHEKLPNNRSDGQ